MRAPQLSVVVATYNRRDLLRAALGSLLEQSGEQRYEVIVVDNNSRDGTADVVQRIAAGAVVPVRYIVEERQGVSYARNAGIAAATAELIAFTDDDVRVPREWVAKLVEAMHRYRDAAYVGGPVHPRWPAAPPPWLTPQLWAPLGVLAIETSEPMRVDANNPRCLVTGNLAVRRSVLHAVGGFDPELQRVGDRLGTAEDHELQIRMWAAGLHGMFLPDLIAVGEIPLERLGKRYHRRWHQGHGRSCAVLRLEEPGQIGAWPAAGASGEPPTLFGSPLSCYVQLAAAPWDWFRARLRGDPAAAFAHEARARYLLNYVYARRATHAREAGISVLAELTRFARALLAGTRRDRRARRQATARE